MQEDPVKQELLQAARGYFTKFGYSRVSTNEIAASTGRSKKTLYKHFGNKEDLLKEVLQDINEEVETEIVSALESEAPFNEMAFDVLIRIGVHESSMADILITDLKEKSPALYNDVVVERDKSLLELLETVFKKGQDAGVVRTDVAMQPIFQMYIAGIKAVADMQSVISNADNPTGMFEGLARVVIDGLCVKN